MPPFENSSSKLISNAVEVLEESQLERVPVKPDAAVDHHAVALKDEIDGRMKAGSLEDVVVEPKTGFKFPSCISFNECQEEDSSSGLQILAGVGERSLTILKLKSIKLYAFGFYVKSDCIRAQLGDKYGIVPPDELKHTSDFYEDLLRHDLQMTVRLMVHYKSLKMNMVRSAFETSLKNRLRKIKGTEDDEGLRVFCSYFKEGLSVPRGTIIDFRWQPGGQLRTEIGGRLIGTIISRDLCRAFFDLYIGDPPVSMKAKYDIGEKLAHMLRTK